MRILVIGGTGFMGPFLIHRLVSEGHEVATLNRGQSSAALPAGVQMIRGERGNLSASAADFRGFAPEVVVDLICYNEAEAIGLMDAFRGAARRVVVASSQDVYRAYGCLFGLEDGAPATAPLTEDAPLRESRYPYRQSAKGEDDRAYHYDKILVERAVMRDPLLPGTILRLPCVYGPKDHMHRTLEYLKRMDDRRTAILISERWATWRWTRGYVENVADAVALAATDDRAANRIYNVGEENALTILEWAGAIANAAGWSGEFVLAPEDELPAHLRTPYNADHHLDCDTGRIRRELNYKEGVSRAEALKRTAAWQRTASPDTAAAQFDYAAEDVALERLRQ